MRMKYGLFGGNVKEPMQTYEGNALKQDKEYVYIYRRTGDTQQQVAAIHLAPGQSVKEIE
jgi:hypothetical protein